MARLFSIAAACVSMLVHAATFALQPAPLPPLPSLAPASAPAPSLPTTALPPPWQLITPGFAARLVEGPRPGTIAIELARPTSKSDATPAVRSNLPAPGAPPKYTDRPDIGGPPATAAAALPVAPADSGTISLVLPAAALAGRTIVFTAQLRTNESTSLAQLWVKVEGKAGRTGFAADTAARPIKPGTYERASITIPVDADAQTLTVGCTLSGAAGATVLLASPQLRPESSAIAGNLPPAPLTGAGRQNLIAAGKLLALLRHFHPDTRCEKTDEQGFDLALIRLLDDAEAAEDPSALLAVLRTCTSQFSGTASLLLAGTPPADTPGNAPSARPPWATHNAAMQHFGVGLGAESDLYWSRRIIEHQDTPPERSRITAAATPWTTPLARGIQLTIPLMLPCDSQGSTLARDTAAPAGPNATSLSEPLRPHRPEFWEPNDGDRTTRLAGVLKAWTTIDLFYPNFTDRPVDWPEALSQALDDAATAKDNAEYIAALRRMMAKLQDGHASVIAAATTAATTADATADTLLPLPLRFVGGKPVVTRHVKLRPESLRRGDVLVSIAGQPIDTLIARYRAETSGASQGWIDHVVLQRIAATPTAKRTDLVVRRDDRDVDVRTNRVPVSEQPEAIERPKNGDEPAPDILYFNLIGLKAEDLAPSFDALASAKAVVFDLRGYPDTAAKQLLSHLLRRPARSLNMLVPMRTRPDDAGLSWQNVGPWELRPKAPRIRAKAVFLTDGSAISYAESCLSIIESLKLGTIVGEQTAATNGNINRLTLPGGITVVFTGLRVTKDDGSPYHGIGVTPQHIVHPTLPGIRAGRDEQLEKAIAILQADEK